LKGSTADNIVRQMSNQRKKPHFSKASIVTSYKFKGTNFNTAQYRQKFDKAATKKKQI